MPALSTVSNNPSLYSMKQDISPKNTPYFGHQTPVAKAGDTLTLTNKPYKKAPTLSNWQQRWNNLWTAFSSAKTLENEGHKYVQEVLVPKDLAKADYYYKRALSQYPAHKISDKAWEMANSLLRHFDDTDGIGDIVLKYLNTSTQWGDREKVEFEVAKKLLHYPDLPLQDGTTFRDKAVELLYYTLSEGDEISALNAYSLFIKKAARHIFDGFHAKHLLEKNMGARNLSSQSHKRLGDIYYLGTEKTYPEPEKALKHYRGYLARLTRFFPKETPNILEKIVLLENSTSKDSERKSEQPEDAPLTLEGARHQIYLALVNHYKDSSTVPKNIQNHAAIIDVLKVINELPPETPFDLLTSQQ